MSTDLALIADLVFGWWKGRRDPSVGVAMSSRAMRFLSGTLPRHRKQVKAR